MALNRQENKLHKMPFWISEADEREIERQPCPCGAETTAIIAQPVADELPAGENISVIAELKIGTGPIVHVLSACCANGHDQMALPLDVREGAASLGSTGRTMCTFESFVVEDEGQGCKACGAKIEIRTEPCAHPSHWAQVGQEMPETSA